MGEYLDWNLQYWLPRPQCFAFTIKIKFRREKTFEVPHLHMIFGNYNDTAGFVLKLIFMFIILCFPLLLCLCLFVCVCLFMQTMMCALALLVNSSVPIISAVWCAPVTLGIAMTGKDIETERNRTAWVRFYSYSYEYIEKIVPILTCSSIDMLQKTILYSFYTANVAQS